MDGNGQYMDKSLFWLTRLCERLRQDPLPAILYIGPLGDCLHDQPFPALEIVFVWSGALKEVQAGRLKRDIGENQAALIGQHFGVHSAHSPGTTSWILLLNVAHEPLFAELTKKPLFVRFDIAHPDRLLAAFRNVAAWSPTVGPHTWNVMSRFPDLSLAVATASRRIGPIHRKAALYELFATLMDEARGADAAIQPGTAVVKQTIDFMIAHYADPSLDMRSLTANAHVCSSHLWRVFKREIDMSPMRFLRDTRLRQGAALLDQTSLRVREIAARVGFQDPLYFTRMFGEAFKCSPVAYRNRIKRSQRPEER